MSNLLTTRGAAARLLIRSTELLKMVRAGEIPFVELPNGEVRIDACDLEQFIQSHKRGVEVEHIRQGMV